MFISRPRELVDQLRQAKAGQERALVTLLHALLREHWRSIACDDRARGVEGETTREHRHPSEHRALRVAKQVIAPIDRRLKRPLTRQHRPRPTSQEAEPLIQTGSDLLDAHRLDTRRAASSIAKWNPVEPPTDLRHLLHIVRCESEVGPGALCPLAEELHRVSRPQTLRVVRFVRKPSDGTRQVDSPGTPIGSRLVASTTNPTHRPSNSATISATGSSRCSQLSSTTNVERSLMRSATILTMSHRAHVRRTRSPPPRATWSPSATAASSTNHAPPA